MHIKYKLEEIEGLNSTSVLG